MNTKLAKSRMRTGQWADIIKDRKGELIKKIIMRLLNGLRCLMKRGMN